MQIDGRSVSPTIPFHLNRAYGVRPQPAAYPVSGTASTVPAMRTIAAERTEGIARLSAGVVPGGVSFDAGTGLPVATAGRLGAGGTYSLYNHPADRNAAATGVQLGRVLDVNG